MVDQQQIYDRQRTLDLFVPNRAVVVGCGGIGSWVGLGLALLGIEELHLVDPDYLEIHNLNRTPFRLDQVAKNKAVALQELILERRNCGVFAYLDFFRPPLSDTLLMLEPSIVVDCTDNLRTRESFHNYPGYVKLGYDGLNWTIDFGGSSIFDIEEQVGYTVVPSFLGTPLFLSAVLINLLATGRFKEYKEQGLIITGNVKEILG
jgi:hypothetical protein